MQNGDLAEVKTKVLVAFKYNGKSIPYSERMRFSKKFKPGLFLFLCHQVHEMERKGKIIVLYHRWFDKHFNQIPIRNVIPHHMEIIIAPGYYKKLFPENSNPTKKKGPS